MLMHSEILALTLQHARPRRCRSPPCFSIPSHFLFLLNYPRLPKSPAPPEGFHGRRLKSGSPCAFAPLPPPLLPGPPLVNLEARVFSPRSHRENFPSGSTTAKISFLLKKLGIKILITASFILMSLYASFTISF